MRWLNPWTWLCWLMVQICTYKAGYWFTTAHPYWDCKTGKPQPWSVAKYGERPQALFYETWERRRMLWLKRLYEIRKTFEQAEREAVRKKYGL